MPKTSSSSVKVFYRKSDRSQIIDQIRSKLDALRAALPITRVVLFGSCAMDTHTVASDVDVLFVYRGESIEGAYKVIHSTLSLRGLEPHIYTDDEAEANRSVIDRMIANGVQIL